MKVLHTADWHLGQQFHGFDRDAEHRFFLEWLCNTLKEEQIDLLLLSGDVYDNGNPSASSMSLFYDFLAKAYRACPGLQTIIIAGNHDAAGRLQAPNPLLNALSVQVIGVPARSTEAEGGLDYSQLVLPVRDAQGQVRAWCVAMPFLKSSDYRWGLSYAEGVGQCYAQAFAYARAQRQPGQAILAMGHLHANGASATADEKEHERSIMGGVEQISTDVFPQEVAYTALGHIHRAQALGGRDNVRYAGTPVPMSFSERHYKHQVVCFKLEGEQAADIRAIEVPTLSEVALLPEKPALLAEVLAKIAALPDVSQEADETYHPPYIKVQVLLEGPQPGLHAQVAQALEGKQARLCKTEVFYPSASNPDGKAADAPKKRSEMLPPMELFKHIYRMKFPKQAAENETADAAGQEVPEELIKCFKEAMANTETNNQNRN